MRTAALEQEGVLGIDRLQTRLFGDRIYVEIDIAADADSTLAEAHTVADRGTRLHRRGIPQGQALHGACQPLYSSAGSGTLHVG